MDDLVDVSVEDGWSSTLAGVYCMVPPNLRKIQIGTTAMPIWARVRGPKGYEAPGSGPNGAFRTVNGELHGGISMICRR